MANLINATVYQIDGNPKDTAVVIAFDTNTIIIQEATVPTISEVTSVIEVKAAKLNAPTIKYYVEETVTELVALANTNGTTLVQATIASINDNPLKVNIQVALPANKVEILDFVSGSVNSYLQYGNDKYYATETKSTLVTAANTSSGGGGIESVTGFGVDNTDPLNPVINGYINGNIKVYEAYFTQSGTSAPVANILSNTVGNIVWTRASQGAYTGTLNGAFLFGKVPTLYAFLGYNGFTETIYALITRTSDDTITISTNFGTSSGGNEDDLLNGIIKLIVLP
jgi:hypothetical protein